VAISGEGGSGKSALAGDLRSKVVQSGGLFVQGKFPQPSAALVDGISPSDAEPFSAFSEATAHLCKSVVEHYAGQSGHSASRTTRTGSFSSLSRFRDKLGSEIGPDAPLIMRVIPESAQLLSRGRHASGPNRHVSFSEPAFEWDASMKEAQHQFKHAFRRFIRAVTRIAPLVLVLDDMQWADIASLDLLEALLSDQETSSLMVVACYRSTGEDATSGDNSEKHGSQIPPPAVCIQTIRTLSAQANSLTFDSIVVGNLDAIQINDLLTDLLSLPTSETLNLAHYVHKKTAGNIFFVIQYLQVLEEASLLQYNICALKWIFDLQAIRDSTFSTENVVYLVKRKLERLPAPTKKVLPIMAWLGS
jgi:predicted ATPase